MRFNDEIKKKKKIKHILLEFDDIPLRFIWNSFSKVLCNKSPGVQTTDHQHGQHSHYVDTVIDYNSLQW